MTALQFIDAFLATFFIGVATLFSAKQFALRARDGDGRAHHGRVFSPQWTGRVLFDLFRAAIFGVCVIRLFAPSIDVYLAPLPGLWESVAVRGAGIALMIFGLWRSFYAHSYLGDEWRSGVRERAGDALVTAGPYSRSRNPIFTAVITAQFGFMLALPSVFSVICFVVGAAVLLRQARIEEDHLQRRFGAIYVAYKARTPRWRLLA